MVRTLSLPSRPSPGQKVAACPFSFLSWSMMGVVLAEARRLEDCLPIASYFLAYSSNSAVSDDTGWRGDDRDGRTWGKAISKSSTQWREGGQGMPMRPISQKLRFPRFPTQQLIVATADSSN